MTKVHRSLLGNLPEQRAVNISTPYGFQENVEQMSQKIADYFSTSLQVTMATLDFRSFRNASEEARSDFLGGVAAANYIFAGPGSPSYALAQWQPLDLGAVLRDQLASGAVVCFSSAAALTLGRWSPPIYEIYKAGHDLNWLPGLDVTAAAGLRCVVIPHYDNAEGATYDTRRCYLSERRLQLMEEQLDDDVSVLGIDEHTAALIDLEAATLRVTGRGGVHWRQHGRVSDFDSGSVIALADLGSSGVAIAPVETVLTAVPVTSSDVEQLLARQESLLVAIDKIRTSARRDGHYEIADALRDAITATGLAVRDAAIDTP